MHSIVFLQPPSPPGLDVERDYAGGFGVASRKARFGYGHGKFAIPYFSLMYSAGVLRRQQYDVSYIDAQAERLDDKTTIARIRNLQPDIVVSVINLPSIYGDGHFLRRLKERCENIKVVCIGTVCRVLPRDVARLSAADIIALGEPELILPDIVKTMQEGGDINSVRGVGIIQDGQLTASSAASDLVDLQKLPWPPYEIMPTTLYRDPHFGSDVRFLPIWSSRGCPMPCSFYCPYPVGMGRTIRPRSSEDFVREIVYLNQNFGITAFTFRDQIFTSNIDRAEEICDLIAEQKLKIQWLCETRFDRVSQGLLRKMKLAGCREVHFGLETGDPELLYKVGKPGTRIATVKEGVRLTKEAGMVPLTQLILGLPGENHVTASNTLKLLKELGITNISVNLVTPYPGTPLFRYAKEHGLLETEDWSRYTSFEAVMRSESMTIPELEDARSLIMEEIIGPAYLIGSIKYPRGIKYRYRNKVKTIKERLLRILTPSQ